MFRTKAVNAAALVLATWSKRHDEAPPFALAALRGEGNTSTNRALKAKANRYQRQLMMGMSDFVPLTCNDNLTVADCQEGGATDPINFASLVSLTTIGEEVVVPCGVCAVVNVIDGSTIDLTAAGLNVEGMLYFPPEANVVLETTHIFVQGILKIDPPLEGNEIRVKTVGALDEKLFPHHQNSGVCGAEGCSVGKRSIVIAGGTLEINGIEDVSCPAWTTLDAALPPTEGVEGAGLRYKVDPFFVQCWGKPGTEMLFTNSETVGGWENQRTGIVKSIDVDQGILEMTPESDVPTDPSTTENDPLFAIEIASLRRPVVFESEIDGPTDETHLDGLHGGHLMVYHTPSVAQSIVGAEFRNMGQQGILGKYPIHFHKCGSVAGSVVKNNVVRDSRQRCFVVHRSDDILLENNVAFDSYGHCYTLEDGVETGNVFKNNLGARTRPLGISIGSTDNEGSTYWITHPNNHFIGNVAAGSKHSGFWFEFSWQLPLGTFKDNIAHSNNEHGISTYQTGTRFPQEALFENMKSYKNKQLGLWLHGTYNVTVLRGIFADNQQSIRNHGNKGTNLVKDTQFIGVSAKEHPNKCPWTPRGVEYEFASKWRQIVLRNSSFVGYSKPECYGLPLRQLNGNFGHFHDTPVMEGLTFEDKSNTFDIEQNFPNAYLEDSDGSMNPSEQPGFFVSDQPDVHFWLDGSGTCSPHTRPNSGALFCHNVCLRRVNVDPGKGDLSMVVKSSLDPSVSFTYERSGSNTVFAALLPAGQYDIHFQNKTDSQQVVTDVELNYYLNPAPTCAEHLKENDVTITTDGNCKKWDTDGWHLGGYIQDLWPSSSPSGSGWKWEECAQECARHPICTFWTLQLEGSRKCQLRHSKRSYNAKSGHMEGGKDLDCLETRSLPPSLPPTLSPSTAPTAPTSAPSTEVVCSKWDTEGWHSGQIITEFWPSESPTGAGWRWQECAKECALHSDCTFWTLQLTGSRKCKIRKNKGSYQGGSNHAEGGKDSNCLELDIPPTSAPTTDGVCSKFDTEGWHGGWAVVTLWPSVSPSGTGWTWQQCARECALRSACKLWTLQLTGSRCCIIKGKKGTYKGGSNHAEGVPDVDCL